VRSAFRHFDLATVRWADMDAIGHVNNAKYFTYCEGARWSYFARLEMDRHRPHPGIGPSLVSAHLDFRAQVHYPAVLEIGVRATAIGRSSFTLAYGLWQQGSDRLVAAGSSVLVWTDYAAGRSLPLPEGLRAAILAVEGGALDPAETNRRPEAGAATAADDA
jgi:acyl-CoA thioester hydrolase